MAKGEERNWDEYRRKAETIFSDRKQSAITMKSQPSIIINW